MNNKTGKNLVGFNCKNGCFALNDGTKTVQPFTYMTSFSKEKNVSVKEIYGDGIMQMALTNDKGFTGKIGATGRDLEYEKALGMVMDVDGGHAEVSIVNSVGHNFGYETSFISDGKVKVKKVWMFGVYTERPSESLSQNTDTINEATIDYDFTCKGTPLMDSTGLKEYVNADGSTVNIWTYTKVPTDTGYATFLDTVPVPKAKE